MMPNKILWQKKCNDILLELKKEHEIDETNQN